jgi:hypothetical protein
MDVDAVLVRFLGIDVDGGKEVTEDIYLLIVDVHGGTGDVGAGLVVVVRRHNVGIHDGRLYSPNIHAIDLYVHKIVSLIDCGRHGGRVHFGVLCSGGFS